MLLTLCTAPAKMSPDLVLLLTAVTAAIVINFVIRAPVNHFEFLVQASYHSVVALSYLLLFYHLLTLLKFITSLVGYA